MSGVAGGRRPSRRAQERAPQGDGRKDTFSALAARSARAVQIHFAPTKRAQGMPGRTLPPRSRTQKDDSGAHEHTGSAETLRHSLRNGLTAYAEFAPVTNSVLVTVAGGLRLIEPVGSTFASAGLTSATDARPTRFCRTRQAASPTAFVRTDFGASRRAQSGITPGRPHAASTHGQARPATTHAPDAAASTATCPSS